MLPPRLPEVLELAVKGKFGVALADEPVEVAELATRLLTHLSPPKWTLEWSLPGWLGEMVGLDQPSVADLTLANAFGLAYVKLQDNLIDGEISADDRAAAVLLSTALHRKWLLVYTQLFPGNSPFWEDFDRSMVQWTNATWASQRDHGQPFAAWDQEELLVLGQRGAPLKIGAAAACLLAQRADLIPPVETALDHLLAGAVLLDQALDWEDDLAAGRYNAFVAYASVRPQTTEQRGANRQAVAEELLVGKAGRPYFRLLRRELAAAQTIARQVGCGDLARFAVWLRGETNAFSKGLAAAAQAQLHRMLEHLFGVAGAHADV